MRPPTASSRPSASVAAAKLTRPTTMLPVGNQRFDVGSYSSAVGVRCMSGPKPPATSTFPSRRRVTAKPMRLVCMLGALPQLSRAGEPRNTCVSLTPYAPCKPVAMSTRPSASSATICASPRDGGPAGVATADHRAGGGGDGDGVALVVAATGASVPLDVEVAVAVAACVDDVGVEAAGAQPPT